jgi:arsenate reductase
MILYGIKTCDTVRKAKKHLESLEINYQFHDFRQDGITPELLEQWLSQHEMDVVLNRKSATWRNLEDISKQDLTTDKVIELMLANPTLIKRPVINANETILVGYRAAEFEQWIQQHV